MELDKRILKGKRPLSLFDTEEAKKFIGSKGYFSLFLSDFKDLDSNDFVQQELTNVDEDETFPYDTDNERSYEYFLPADWVNVENSQKEDKDEARQ